MPNLTPAPLFCRWTVRDRDGNLIGTATGYSLQETGMICPDGGTLATSVVAYETPPWER